MSSQRMIRHVLECMPEPPTELSAQQIYDRTNKTFTFKTLRGTLMDLQADALIVKGGTAAAPTYRRSA